MTQQNERVSVVNYTRLDGQERVYKNAELVEQLITKDNNKLWVIKTEDGEYKRLRVNQTSIVK